MPLTKEEILEIISRADFRAEFLQLEIANQRREVKLVPLQFYAASTVAGIIKFICAEALPELAAKVDLSDITTFPKNGEFWMATVLSAIAGASVFALSVNQILKNNEQNKRNLLAQYALQDVDWLALQAQDKEFAQATAAFSPMPDDMRRGIIVRLQLAGQILFITVPFALWVTLQKKVDKADLAAKDFGMAAALAGEFAALAKGLKLKITAPLIFQTCTAFFATFLAGQWLEEALKTGQIESPAEKISAQLLIQPLAGFAGALAGGLLALWEASINHGKNVERALHNEPELTRLQRAGRVLQRFGQYLVCKPCKEAKEGDQPLLERKTYITYQDPKIGALIATVRQQRLPLPAPSAAGGANSIASGSQSDGVSAVDKSAELLRSGTDAAVSEPAACLATATP